MSDGDSGDFSWLAEGTVGFLNAARGIARICEGVNNLDLDTEEARDRARTPARGSNNDESVRDIMEGLVGLGIGAVGISSGYNGYNSWRSQTRDHQLEITEFSDTDGDDEDDRPGRAIFYPESARTAAISEEEGDRKLRHALGCFERDRINPRYKQDIQRSKRELVQHLIEEFIHPTLEKYRSDVFYTGSSYEYCGIQDSSDYDLQFCIKMPQRRHNNFTLVSDKPYVELCKETPGWAMIRSGPPELLTGDGYMSAVKARQLLTRELDKGRSNLNFTFHGSPARMNRSVHGPAITLSVMWSSESLDIDVVSCISADDVYNSNGWDLIAKPYDKTDQWAHPKLWRLSYSRKEKELFSDFNRTTPKKITLMKVFKVIRSSQSQLEHLPSYFYKNVLFRLSESTDNDDWKENNSLRDRFKDMIKMIVAKLNNGRMPIFFNSKVDLLASKDSVQIYNIARYLERIVSKNTYYELLQI